MISDEPRIIQRSGTNSAVAARTFGTVYNGHDIRFAPTKRFVFRHRTIRDRNVSLMSSAVSADWIGSFTPDGRILLAWSTAGSLHIDDDTPTRPGIPVLLPTAHPFTVAAPAGTVQLISLDSGFVNAVQGVVLNRPPGYATLHLEPLDAALPHLLTCIKAVADNAFNAQHVVPEHLSAQVLLAESILYSFGGASLEYQQRHALSMASNVVQRAQVWLGEHCDGPVQLSDICDVVGVSARALQENFTKHLGVSPMAYLLTIRLDRVRIALQLANASETTVGMVAASWGFRHLGRFSNTYHNRYGEYPKQTLRTPSSAAGR